MKLRDLLDSAMRLNETSFPKQFPDPALVFDARSPGTGEVVQVDTPSEGTMAFKRTSALKTTDVIPAIAEASLAALGSMPQGGDDARLDSVVIFLVKTQRNPFAGMITVGRARNNDICLPLSSVSKVHAYFAKKLGENVWRLTDQKSTNGTFVDERRLDMGGGADLHEGARIGFGPDTLARYFTPQGLFGYLALCRAGL